MAERQVRTLSSFTSWVLGLLLLAVAVLLPAAYFFVKHTHYTSTARAEGSLAAAFLSQLLARHPELAQAGQTEQHLLEMIDIHLDDPEHDLGGEQRSMRDRYLRPLSTRDAAATAARPNLPWPVVEAVVPVRQANEVIYHLVLQRSLRPVLRETLWIALGSALLASAVGFALKRLPLQALRRAEQRLSFMAHYDSLTGLPNRNLLRDKLRKALVDAERAPSQLALLYLDLDRLKSVNDSLGHGVGDQVIYAAGQRIRNSVRSSDTVARLSGDEFALVLEHVRDVEGVATVARNVLEKLRQPFKVGEHELYLSASMGAALYPSQGQSAEDLLKNADAAMYSAKMQRDTFQFYRSEMNTHIQEEMRLEGALRRALDNREFLLYYQPILDSSGERVIGTEALLRWQHPERGLVPPLQFIRLLENSGLIIQVGAWVLREACEQAKRWRAAGLGPLTISVNVSARQFKDKTLVETVRNALVETECPPHLLQLELTETVLMSDHEATLSRLRELTSLGLRIAIDDFGTGYSSLAYLLRFPVHRLKIDRSFVKELPGNEDNAAIVSAVIQLSHTLRLQVTAEGVETAEQRQFLRERRCDALQGFLFSKPLPAAEFERYLQTRLAGSESLASLRLG